jgi:hypothetical protein
MMLTMRAGHESNAHHHANQLAITLYAGGQRVITGPGYPPYADPDARRRLIATSAESTVSVDGRSQARGAAPILFFRQETRSDGHTPIWGATAAVSHLYEGVRHQRTLLFGPEAGAVIILDECVSDDVHEYRQQFRMGEGVELANPQRAVHALLQAGEKVLLRLRPHAVLDGTVKDGTEIRQDGRMALVCGRGRSAVIATVLRTRTAPVKGVQLTSGGLRWVGPLGELSVSLPLRDETQLSWQARPIAPGPSGG